MKKILLLLLHILFCVGLSAQEAYFEYTFDDCSFEDTFQRFPGITPGGVPKCVCGLGTNSIELDGDKQFLTFSSQVNPLMDVDFTLDMYFFMEIQDGETDIFSIRNGCGGLDSMMALRYFSNTNEILFEIGSNVNNYYSVRKKLSSELCWHRFTLAKFGLSYFVYLDNELLTRIISNESINFSRLGKFSIGNSPCNNTNQAKRFKGSIDEVVLYKRALSDREIIQMYKYPDRIITNNTTIFKGESILLEIGESCSNSIFWSPAATLDHPDELSTLATPQQTTNYKVSLDNGKCISSDTVTIYVADKDKLDCNRLLLPKAFTPNNDGLNERFGISNLFLIDELEYFEIYDRWGAKVWETKLMNETWDGSINGQPLNSGMYLYKIKYTCKGEERLNVNNFTMLR